MELTLVATWFGVFVVDPHGAVRERYPSPGQPVEIAQRIAERRAGALTPEERAAIAAHPAGSLVTSDRRLASHGPRWDPAVSGVVDRAETPTELGPLREGVLDVARRELRESWDPSVHVEEAVRALRDLDRALNLLGERVGSWAARDRPDLDPGDAAEAARLVLDEVATAERGSTSPDPDLSSARRSLARTYRALEGTRGELDRAIRASAPSSTPNLSALLSPELAARLVAAAGGLDRLSRLPASTVQVLGAERAFFEHLRGRAPPPRHGLLFLHARIQSAPRVARGRLARALGGKAAIAARLDSAGRPLDPRLAEQFEVRARAIRAQPNRARSPRGSRRPLDRAPADR